MSNHLGDINKMVETPRTQAVWELFATGTTLPHDVEFSTLARQLERELNEANDRIKRLEEAGDFLSRYLREMPYASDYLAQVDERILRISNWRRAKEDNL